MYTQIMSTMEEEANLVMELFSSLWVIKLGFWGSCTVVSKLGGATALNHNVFSFYLYLVLKCGGKW